MGILPMIFHGRDAHATVSKRWHLRIPAFDVISVTWKRSPALGLDRKPWLIRSYRGKNEESPGPAFLDMRQSRWQHKTTSFAWGARPEWPVSNAPF